MRRKHILVEDTKREKKKKEKFMKCILEEVEKNRIPHTEEYSLDKIGGEEERMGVDTIRN